MLTQFTLPGVVINKKLEVLQFRGRTGAFLEPPQGEPSLNLLKLARDGLASDLRRVIDKAARKGVRVRQEGLRVRQDGRELACAVEVLPLQGSPKADPCFLVLFDPGAAYIDRPSQGTGKRRSVVGPKKRSELEELQRELAATRETLQTIIEEQEVTNEELRSANEEVLSSNEELQSTNEELETAKEELQSTNEELITLNDELESRNGELERVNNDLYNLLGSVNIPLLILDPKLCIRRFTSLAEKLFKLIPSDIGRPVTDINLPLCIPSLDELVKDVVDSLTPKDIELQDHQGNWWSVRIRPYKTADQKIDGAVVAMVDFNEIKLSMQRMVQARDLAENIVNTVREALLVLDHKLQVSSANRSFYRMFMVTPGDTLGKSIFDLGSGRWNHPSLRKLLEEILPEEKNLVDFEIEVDIPRLGSRKMLLNASQMSHDGQPDPTILLAINDCD
jgi:two-component system CheB/CheR fusion protein